MTIRRSRSLPVAIPTRAKFPINRELVSKQLRLVESMPPNSIKPVHKS